MYRGILFFGVNSKHSELVTVLVTSVVFGLFHYVNLFTGAGFEDTTYQVTHAFAAGFMYATLRLRIGSIWAVMFFHGLWDFVIFLTQSIGEQEFVEPATNVDPVTALIVMVPAMLYGIFVYWRWCVWNKS